MGLLEQSPLDTRDGDDYNLNFLLPKKIFIVSLKSLFSMLQRQVGRALIGKPCSVCVCVLYLCHKKARRYIEYACP